MLQQPMPPPRIIMTRSNDDDGEYRLPIPVFLSAMQLSFGV
jgi:hypothetical protein